MHTISGNLAVKTPFRKVRDVLLKAIAGMKAEPVDIFSCNIAAERFVIVSGKYMDCEVSFFCDVALDCFPESVTLVMPVKRAPGYYRDTINLTVTPDMCLQPCLVTIGTNMVARKEIRNWENPKHLEEACNDLRLRAKAMRFMKLDHSRFSFERKVVH